MCHHATHFFALAWFFDLIRSVDKFVILDHVQFEKQSWQQRNRIRNKQGELVLSLAVQHEMGLERKINSVKLDYSRNSNFKHLESIKHSYSKSMNFEAIFPEIEFIFNQKHALLIDLNIELIKLGMKYLSIEKEFIYSSKIDVLGQRVEALIDICNKVGANKYLSPVGSKAYIDENNLFPSNNIELTYQLFKHPVYKQIGYHDFISHLSFIDYLFNTELNEVKKFGSFNTN